MSVASWELWGLPLSASDVGVAVMGVVCSEIRCLSGVAAKTELGIGLSFEVLVTTSGKAGVKAFVVEGGEESIEIGDIVGEGGPLDLPDALVEPGLSPTIAFVGIGVDSSSMEVGFIPSRSMISGGRSLFLAESKGESDEISLPSGRSGIGEVALSIVIVLTASGNAIAVGGGLGRHLLMARPRSSNPTL